MKKYLFLFCLFIIYLILLINKKEQVESVFLSSDSYSPNIEMNINFNTEVNSNNLINNLSEYDSEYLIKSIGINKISYEVNCTNIKKCYEDIYNLNNNDFYNKYITNGFTIGNINIISNKDNLINFLDLNNYNYTINFF